MRHAVRQAEAGRADIRAFFRELLGYEELDLSTQPGVCELTGCLVIDHRRRIGFCGLGERCDEAGARAMHEAFGLRATLLFDLAEGEYHTNVVLSVLAGRSAMVAPDGFADRAVAHAIIGFYAPHAVELSPAQKQAFAANCLAMTPDEVWVSAAGATALEPAQRERLGGAGFSLRAIPLDELEKAGGSLRCCIAEVY
jgi:N-dimethylarginine dimethylaminohydrolase